MDRSDEFVVLASFIAVMFLFITAVVLYLLRERPGDGVIEEHEE